MKKTLVVIGAGASKDFCPIFPTGIELIQQINYHLLTEKKDNEDGRKNGPYLSPVMNQIREVFFKEIPEVVMDNFCNRLKNLLWNRQMHYEEKYIRKVEDDILSIDRFVAQEISGSAFNHDEKSKASDIIKYCICYLVKGSEGAVVAGNHDLENNWIRTLVNKLPPDFEEVSEKLQVINFNYDRIFEKYFSEYAQSRWSATEKIKKFVSTFSSVYGNLGSLVSLPFECKNEDPKLLARTYTKIHLADERNTRKIEISENTERIHFVGFGYDPLNLQKIGLNRFKKAKISGTAYRMPVIVTSKLDLNSNIHLYDYSCFDYVSKCLFI